jgi:hypothetical protein
MYREDEHCDEDDDDQVSKLVDRLNRLDQHEPKGSHEVVLAPTRTCTNASTKPRGTDAHTKPEFPFKTQQSARPH